METARKTLRNWDEVLAREDVAGLLHDVELCRCCYVDDVDAEAVKNALEMLSSLVSCSEASHDSDGVVRACSGDVAAYAQVCIGEMAGDVF